LAKELGVEREVIFHNRFVSPQEMASLVGSADIYITPYRYEAQAVSGTLAYTLGAGKAIVSTPDWHAAELLSEGRGALVRFENPNALASATIELLENDAARQTMRQRAYKYGRQMVWTRVAQSYMRTFYAALANRMKSAHLRSHFHAIEREVASQLLSA
jgi:glycosyltransferase involved in cell wall biosynthesis